MTKRKKTIRVSEDPNTMIITINHAERFREIRDVVNFGLDGKFLVVDALEGGLIRKHVFNMDYYEGYDVLLPPKPPTPTIH